MLNQGRSVLKRFIHSVFRNNINGSEVIGKFDPKYYYNDLRYLIVDVNMQIQSGMKITEEFVMNPIRDRYDCCGVMECLLHWIELEDPKLKKMTNDFAENMICYGSSFYLKNNGTDKKIECQATSDKLRGRILKRIDSLMVR
jgi:hypothetical protein